MKDMAFEGLTKATTNTVVLDVTPCGVVQIYLSFGGASAVFCQQSMSVGFYFIRCHIFRGIPCMGVRARTLQGGGKGEGFCVVIFQQLQQSTNVQGRMKEIIGEKIC